MKTNFLLLILMLACVLLQAQNKEKKATVHIKKVETVNGVTRTVDTTFTTNDPNSFHMNGMEIINETAGKDGNTMVTVINDSDAKDGKKTKKVIHITSGDVSSPGNAYAYSTGDGGAVTVISSGDGDDKEIEKALKEAGVDGKKGCSQKVVIINEENEKPEDKSCKTKTTKIVIVKNMKVSDPAPADLKLLGKPAGVSDGNLSLNKIELYPNPANGKFALKFDLPEKGDTEIAIFNTEGKNIYNESVKDFSGHFEKEIDLSKNPKGIYFLRVDQGKNSQLKKIVLE